MPIRAVVFDIGGILEIAPGGEPTARFPQMIGAWEGRLDLEAGVLQAHLSALDERFKRMGKDGALGMCTEEEWWEELRLVTRMSQEHITAFIEDFWDVYLGELNAELAAYFSDLRPRYRTALLSNSFVGARAREQERFHFETMTDLIVYSHEEGIAKPDPRIFERTCDRLSVQPGEIIFLDDAETNVAAACELGIHAILFHDTAQAIADINACLRA